MKIRITLLAACALAILPGAAPAAAQEGAMEKQDMKHEDMQHGDMKHEDMMEHGEMPPDMAKMMELAQPGEHHRVLDHMVGDWKVVTRFWMQPDQPPMESEGTMEAHWILDGRFVVSTYKGDFMGQPFEGRGIDGYDNFAGEFTSVWMDTMGTYILMLSGDCDDEDCTARTVSGQFTDPISGQTMVNKGTTTVIDEDTYKYEAYMSPAGGEETKVMELIATRR